MAADEGFGGGEGAAVRGQAVEVVAGVEDVNDVFAETPPGFGFESACAAGADVGGEDVEEVDAVGLDDEGVAVEEPVRELAAHGGLVAADEAGVGEVHLASDDVFGADFGADEEVGGDVVAFGEFIAGADALDDFAFVLTAGGGVFVEDVEAVLDDVFGVGVLLVDGFADDFVAVEVVFAVADEVDLFLRDEGSVAVDVVDALAVAGVFEVGDFGHVVSDEEVDHVFEYEVEAAHEEGFFVVAAAADVFCFVEEDVEELPEGDELVGEVFPADGAEQACALSCGNHVFYPAGLDEGVVEVGLYGETVGLPEVFEDGVEENDDVLVVVDGLVAVAELRVERHAGADEGLNLADGLGPMDFVVAAGVDDGDVGDEIAVLLVEAEQREHGVEEGLAGAAFVGDDVLDLGVLDDAAVAVSGVVALDGLVEPGGEVEHNGVEAVEPERIVGVFEVDDVFGTVSAEGDFALSGIAFSFE